MTDKYRQFYLDGLTTQAMVSLTGGVFLVGLALELGASNTFIGLLAAIPALAQLLQLPGTWLIQKYRDRKRITIISAALSRLFLLGIAAVPFLLSAELGLFMLTLLLTLNSSFGAIGGASWNSWMRDFLPDNHLGRIFSRRMRYALMVGIPLGLAAGFYIDYAGLPGYAVLFALGAIAGLLGLLFIGRIENVSLEGGRQKFMKLLRPPFQDRNFKNLLFFSGSWNFAVNLAAPFFTVYMLSLLGYGMGIVLVMVTVSQLAHLYFLSLWGRFADKYSNKSVLRASGPIFLIAVLLWTFTTLPEPHLFTLPLLTIIHILMGVAMAGVTLASGNIGMKLAPRGEATSYLAANSIIISVAAGIAPIIGGLLADFFSVRELTLTLTWTGEHIFRFQALSFQQWDFFFFFAFLLGLYSLHRLSLVEEQGSVQEKVVLSEMLGEVKHSLRNFSSIGGLQQAFEFPFVAVLNVIKRLK